MKAREDEAKARRENDHVVNPLAGRCLALEERKQAAGEAAAAAAAEAAAATAAASMATAAANAKRTLDFMRSVIRKMNK